MEITTNGHRLAIIELVEDEECGWRPARVEDFGFDEELNYPVFAQGFRYRGDYYALSEFERIRVGLTTAELQDPLVAGGWQGVQSDSAWSGVAVKIIPAGTAPSFEMDDSVVVASLYWG